VFSLARRSAAVDALRARPRERDVDDRDQHEREQQRTGQAADHHRPQRPCRRSARIQHEREREHAGDHRHRRHDDRAEPFPRRFAHRENTIEPLAHAAVGEVDQQNSVLRYQTDQQHRSD